MRCYLVVIACVTIAAGLAACGDSGNGEPAQAGEAPPGESGTKSAFEREHPGSARYGSPPLEFEADPGGELAYTTDEVTAKDGNVTIEFTNPQPTPHNVAIEAVGDGRVETETVSEGFAATTITLSSDERYVFYCTVPGHRKAGMKGIVKVVPR